MSIERREFVAGASALLFSTGLFPAFATAATEPGGLPLHLVHPELRPLLPRFQEFASKSPPMTRANLAQMRAGQNSFAQPPLPDVPWQRRVIAGAKGQPDVAIYIVNARRGAARPAILHTHGGGYIMGKAEGGLRDLQGICKTLDCVAVSVDYRLAPETTYAGSIEDNYTGLTWLHANAAELGADPAKIALMGESAGGGHAALLAIAARDRGKVPVCFQCLIYPMLDDRTGSTRAVPPHVGTLVWTAASNRFGWEAFLGQRPGGPGVPAAAVPARVSNLKGLPPAFIAVGSLDLFYDEDVDYAQRLNAAGVPAELIGVQGAFHGFDFMASMAKLPLGRWFENTKLNALRRGFGMAAV